MNMTLITLGIAFFIVLLCLILLGISWIFTGKSRLRVGMCGKDPTKKRSNDAGCETKNTCGICGKSNDTEEDK